MELVDAQRFRKKLQGVEVDLITLQNDNGLVMQVTNYGARIVSLWVPDRHGHKADVVLGYDNLEAYVHDPFYLGAVIGRCANRITDGRFSLFGKTYQLTRNADPDHLHGGIMGLHAKVWIMEQLSEKEVLLSVGSPDGEEGYPGSVNFEVRYRLRDDNALHINFMARSDQATIVNLTNHSYFNLSGDPQRSIFDHFLRIEADYFTPVNERLLPTGEIRSVKDSALDFSVLKQIENQLLINDEQVRLAGGFDHNFVLRRTNQKIIKAATLIEKQSGRKLEVFTNEPGVQFYSGNALKETSGKYGQRFTKHSALSLETQHFPDSPNHPHFPMTILMPDQIYRQDTIFQFTVTNEE